MCVNKINSVVKATAYSGKNKKKVEPLKDTDLMPFGKYQGEEMQDVPASYLIWLYESTKCNERIKAYIEENRDVLDFEVKE